ncbi:MAG: hypothetical protein K6357_01760 [Elusimicrobiota bacterium]
MRFISFGLLFLFLLSSLNLNLYVSFLSLFLIIIIVFSVSRKSLRFSGGLRFWIFPFIFFFILSFDFSILRFDRLSFLKNFKMFFHLYIFNVFVNLINDLIRLKDIYMFFEKKGFRFMKFYILFSFSIMKKMKVEISEIFFFYRLNNKGFNFIKNIHMLVYSCIRNALNICYFMVEVMYLRGLYENR